MNKSKLSMIFISIRGTLREGWLKIRGRMGLLTPKAARAMKSDPIPHSKRIIKKASYHPVARGTTFLVDTANLIGAIGPEHAASRLTSLREMLACAGHTVVYFWEHGAYVWTKAQQETDEEKRALAAFVSRDDVSLVSGEADLAILQTAQVTPNSICLTCDRYRDYAETYPQIVGSARHRPFSVAKIAGMVTLSVFGLKDAIVLSTHNRHQAPSVAACDAIPMAVANPVVRRNLGLARRKGLYGCVDARLALGDGRTAVKILAKIAKTNPSAYAEISRIYKEGDGVPVNERASRHYAELAKKGEKANRHLTRRQMRMVENCMTGLDYASIRGAKDLFLAHNLVQCARRKDECRKSRRPASCSRLCASTHPIRDVA